MTTVFDIPAPDWAWRWASSLAHVQIRSCTQTRSSEVNAVFRLGCDGVGLFLKVGPELGREYDRLRWLEGRLPAPRPLGLTARGGVDALLMTAVEGDDLAQLSASLAPRTIIARLAAALKVVHATDVAGWPFGGPGAGLVHGDACLPNVLYRGDRLSGFIDVGDMAVGDPDVDLAAAVWSLQYNLGPGYGLAFLREYGMTDADDECVERLRLSYETGCP